MKRGLWVALLGCCLAALWIVSASLAGVGDKRAPEADFAPKVLMIYCKDPAKGAFLGDVRLRQLGGRSFLVGKVLSRDGSTTALTNATHWVALDEVVEMLEFSSVEEARKAEAAQSTAPKP